MSIKTASPDIFTIAFIIFWLVTASTCAGPYWRGILSFVGLFVAVIVVLAAINCVLSRIRGL